ncbi:MULTISPECIES: hypothetical protein [unclassified Streptomyces]|uniref:hypothetical protein n=1 Tax=unclassified Streptomyces TaxID=2593676 RepID=UPI0033245C45
MLTRFSYSRQALRCDGIALVERDALGGLQLGGAEECGDFARHVEGDGQAAQRI